MIKPYIYVLAAQPGEVHASVHFVCKSAIKPSDISDQIYMYMYSFPLSIICQSIAGFPPNISLDFPNSLL